MDERETLSLAIIGSELDRLVDPFGETADLTHVTASAIVVGPRGVILHKHRRLGRWMQPGGHIEPGESPEQAAVRECLEETGLAVVHGADGPMMVHVDVHRAAKEHIHLDIRFLVHGPDEDPRPAAGESQDVAWFEWDVAAAMADVSLAGALVSARRLVGPSGPERSKYQGWPGRPA